MSHYQQHLFFCCNIKENNKICCGKSNALEMYRYAKDKCRTQGLLQQGIAVTQTRCLGRCELGPVAVVYPEGSWYQFVDTEDIDDIINEHLINHKPVKRLLVK